MARRACFFAGWAGPCDGRLIKAHLIPRQVLKREGHGNLIEDERTFVLCCGGPMGISGHHGRLDARGCDPLRIPRHRLPGPFTALMEDVGLDWWVAREYGPV